MKRNLILIVTLGVFLIGLGILLNYLNETFKQNKDLKNRINIVLNGYDDFEKQIEVINGEREIVNHEVFNYLYDENVSNNYDGWVKRLDSYKSSVKKIYEYKSDIINVCVNEKYKDSNVTSKCESMIIGYETVVNYFVKDADAFNKFVDSYNNQYPDKVVNKYLFNYNYVDINDDGKYLGK